ncbi:MAG: dehydrogenase [Burkholderiales bacterium]|nr:dehydrogenase [Burkholderiales bacterium]
MAFLLMILEPRGQRSDRTLDEGRELFDRMVAFGDDLREKGILLATESLRADDHAIRVRQVSGKAQLLDGPFAEAKEMVGGFYLLNVASRDEAVAIAARCPAVEWATVEVRECAPCYVS